MEAEAKAKAVADQMLIQNFPWKGDKPQFDQIIEAQTSEGNWKVQSLSLFENLVASQDLKDLDLLKALKLDQYKQIADIESVYVTLLAIYILEKVYASEASEAAMIIANGKTYCKNAGVRNPNAILKKFTFLLRP